MTYPIDHEENGSNSENYGVADEGFAGKACNWAWFFDLQHDEGESEGLYGPCQCED